MPRLNDDVKLLEVAKRYSRKHPVLTSEMLFNHILDKKIKFRGSMSRTRIGALLSRSNQYNVLRDKKFCQFERKK